MWDLEILAIVDFVAAGGIRVSQTHVLFCKVLVQTKDKPTHRPMEMSAFMKKGRMTFCRDVSTISKLILTYYFGRITLYLLHCNCEN